jgi:hypothetical protein
MVSDTAADDIERLREMLDDLEDIRGRFGRANGDGDDYRQARIDVATANIAKAEAMIHEYAEADAWPDE